VGKHGDLVSRGLQPLDNEPNRGQRDTTSHKVPSCGRSRLRIDPNCTEIESEPIFNTLRNRGWLPSAGHEVR
jgi:hypothetical protein